MLNLHRVNALDTQLPTSSRIFLRKHFREDFAYAAGLHLNGIASSIAGGDFHSSMQAAVMFGGQTQIAASIRAANVGEMEASEWTAWTPKDKAQALANAQNGTLNALGLADAFDSIRNALAQGKISVSMGSPWYSEWERNTGADGIMPMPANVNNITGLPWHNYKICGQKDHQQRAIPYREVVARHEVWQWRVRLYEPRGLRCGTKPDRHGSTDV